MLDAGCALGFLVEALRERGVDARGFDVSEYAIAQVPEPLKPYCTLGSVTDEIDGHYDLITCIEVLEHVARDVAEAAIDNFSRHTDRILFSSTPADRSEPTHVNVLPPDEWVRMFAARGFLPAPSTGTSAVSAQAVVLERDGPEAVDRLGAYEAMRYELVQKVTAAEDASSSLRQELHEAEERLRAVDGRVTAAEAARTRAARALDQHVLARRAADRRARAAEAEARRHTQQAAELAAALEELRATTWWRLGRPFRAAVTAARLRARHPTVAGAIAAGARQPLVRGAAVRVRSALPPPARAALKARFPTAVEQLNLPPPPPPTLVEDLVAERLPLLRPLAVFPVPGDGRLHLSVLTDSLSPGSLFGGVGTSMILAALLARRLGASLRVVTRNELPDPVNFGVVLRAHGIDWEHNVEFSYAPLDGRRSGIASRAGEIFLTTSWWSTWSALRSVDPKRIVYLLQEDERLFYPAGDEHVACAEVMGDRRIRFAINTEMLHDYLVADGFDNIAENGAFFEPAFPESIYFRDAERDGGRRRFFFYARPNNVRNLFFRGLEAVSEAVARRILDPEEWELHFVGSGVPRVTLPYGTSPQISELLPWPEYAALLRRTDVGLSLMSSPHPSYPPLDLAACGAVAVTNRFGIKQSLERYSANILCADSSRDALVDCIGAATALAADESRRTSNYRSQRLSRSWAASLDGLVDGLARSL